LVPRTCYCVYMEVSSRSPKGNVSNRSQIWQAGLRHIAKGRFGIGVGNSKQHSATLHFRVPNKSPTMFSSTCLPNVVGVTLFTLIILTTFLLLLRLPWPDWTVYCFYGWRFISITQMKTLRHTWALLVILNDAARLCAHLSYLARLPIAPGLTRSRTAAVRYSHVMD